MPTVNIGILAHVDAGKTSLTERLLYSAGIIDHLGSVDRGDTQTDSLHLERQRGITIRSAVVSFTVGEVKINLIDTPGHPDFISEVERALSVLDGVILVLSAVEGVQAQTRLLMRTLIKMRMPILLFVNKIDRIGAQYGDLLDSIRTGLTRAVVPMTTVDEIGTPGARTVRRRVTDDDVAAEFADAMAGRDDTFLSRYLDERTPLTEQDYIAELAWQTRAAMLYPVFFGSAMTGAGVEDLVDGIAQYFSLEGTEPGAGLRAVVFKIERDRTGEKVAYVRVYSGVLRARMRSDFHRIGRYGIVSGLTDRTTVVEVFDHGAHAIKAEARPGEIAKVWGLKAIQIGDQLGTADGLGGQPLFASPSLETVVRPTRAGTAPALYEALRQLADQDPFINVRKNDEEQEIVVSLYGEVQKEVIKATLADDFGIDVVFEGTRVVCVERLVGGGEAVAEIDPKGRNVFWATVGLRVAPGEPGSGIAFRLEVELGSLPLAFHKAIEETVHSTLRQGIYGWEVLDVLVTLTHTGYASPISAAGDFRKLTPLVLMNALKRAGTQVFEPVDQFELEVPADTVSIVLTSLAKYRGVPDNVRAHGDISLVEGIIPVQGAQDFAPVLPALSKGEGVLVTRFHSFRPVTGRVPVRQRTDANPLDDKEYLLHTLRRI